MYRVVLLTLVKNVPMHEIGIVKSGWLMLIQWQYIQYYLDYSIINWQFNSIVFDTQVN